MGGFIAARGVTNVWPVISIISLAASIAMLMLGNLEKRSKMKSVTENAMS
jgi:membrane protein DedA with SNARE-associated domain